MRGGAEIKENIKILIPTAICVTALDQVTKAVVSHGMALNESIAVVPGFFNLVFIKNPGAAFGILSRAGAVSKIILIAATIAELFIILLLLKDAKTRILAFALSMIAGGAVGNLIDRLKNGSVVDFLDFYVGGLHWPAFNVADSAITTGVVIALIAMYFRGGRRENRRQ
ncbi:MAG: signal peptidase II [Deltaproteobacteria bacterium]